jgi:hypothetical protein
MPAVARIDPKNIFSVGYAAFGYAEVVEVRDVKGTSSA